MITKINSSQQNLLEALSEFYNVICVSDPSGVIDTEIFVTNEYVTSTTQNPFLSIRGYRKITDIVAANSVFVNNVDSLGSIKTQVDSLKILNRERKFSDHFQWIKF